MGFHCSYLGKKYIIPSSDELALREGISDSCRGHTVQQGTPRRAKNGGTEEGREGGREGGTEGGTEGGRKGSREGGREGGREEGIEEGRDRGREGGRADPICCHFLRTLRDIPIRSSFSSFVL